MIRILIFTFWVSIAVCPIYIQASDTDAQPFMIYIDPETGKYTKTRPGHENPMQKQEGLISDVSNQTTVPTPIVPAITICVALLVVSHLSAYLLSRMVR